MLIRAGFDIAFECAATTSMLLQLNVHPSREADLRSPDVIKSDPPLAMTAYLDLFGNRVTRVDAPPGRVTFSNRFVIHDSGEPDDRRPKRERRPSATSPTTSCCSCCRAAIATATTSPISPGRQFGGIAGGYERVQAICDFVHAHRLWLPEPPTRSACDSMRESRRLPRLRPSRHRALPRMNIPARYCTGYLGDIGVPPIPTRWISAPGSRCFWTASGTPSTRDTTIRALAASSSPEVATPPTSRSRPLSASPISCNSKLSPKNRRSRKSRRPDTGGARPASRARKGNEALNSPSR